MNVKTIKFFGSSDLIGHRPTHYQHRYRIPKIRFLEFGLPVASQVIRTGCPEKYKTSYTLK
jgi:hypothetical protein